MRLTCALAIVALFFVCSCFSQATVVTISSSGKFAGMTPLNDGRWRYLLYVTNSTWQPAYMRWDCNTVSPLCDPDECDTDDADAPWCHNPTVPSNSPLTLALDEFPWQIRWGIPNDVGDSHGVGIPSGFGFKGTLNQNLNNIYQAFWIGQAVHFNNVIHGGYQVGSWDFIITLYYTPAGGTMQQEDFQYRLNLDETLNACSSYGCPWDSNSWFASNRNADTYTSCPIAETPTLGSGRNRVGCCRYWTKKDYPCADRVWTIDALNQEKRITINGRPYTLLVQGFSVPGTPNVKKTYFISQERDNTRADIWAQLIDACPETACPGGTPVIIVDNACVCDCTNTCPAGQRRTSICGCECDPAQTSCGAGIVNPVPVGNTCTCNCGGVTCQAPKTPNANCVCTCPPNPSCTGTINPATCGCTCPTTPCSTGHVRNANCECVCPTGAEAACLAQSGTYNPGNCSCTVCVCPDTPCQTNGACTGPGGSCEYANILNQACLPDGSANTDRCVAYCNQTSGECVYNPIDCTPGGDQYDDECAACVPSTGQCANASDNTDCSRPLTAPFAAPYNMTYGAEDIPCLQSVCVGGRCAIVPKTEEGLPCELDIIPDNDQCNAAVCVAGQCTVQPKVNQPCSDGLGCTYYANFSDPITGGLSDKCVLDDDEELATCQNNARLCSDMRLECNTITCIDTPAGAFCEMRPMPGGTTCDDQQDCTEGDKCQEQLEADPVRGILVWVANGICLGQAKLCPDRGNPCEVGRCQAGQDCVYNTEVLNGEVCNAEEGDCKVNRCDDGECKLAENLCPAASSNKGAIIGAVVGGVVAALLAGAAVAAARARMAKSKVFDPATWDQIQAGAGVNSPLYEPRSTEVTSALYTN